MMTKKDLACPCCKQIGAQSILVDAINRLQKRRGKKLVATSGFRCDLHNAATKGSKGSYHRKGLAIDLLIDPKEHDSIVADAKAEGFKGIGHGGSLLHLDLGPAREWGYDEHGNVVAWTEELRAKLYPRA